MILEVRLIIRIIFLMQWVFLLLTFKSLQIAIAMFCPALSHLPFGKSTKKARCQTFSLSGSEESTLCNGIHLALSRTNLTKLTALCEAHSLVRNQAKINKTNTMLLKLSGTFTTLPMKQMFNIFIFVKSKLIFHFQR